MENQNQPEVLSSIALANVGGQACIEYNVNGMRDVFMLNWEQIAELQEKWRNELFVLRGQREKLRKAREEEIARNGVETDEKTEGVCEDVQTVDDGSIAKENANEGDSE